MQNKLRLGKIETKMWLHPKEEVAKNKALFLTLDLILNSLLILQEIRGNLKRESIRVWPFCSESTGSIYWTCKLYFIFVIEYDYRFATSITLYYYETFPACLVVHCKFLLHCWLCDQQLPAYRIRPLAWHPRKQMSSLTCNIKPLFGHLKTLSLVIL